MLVSKQRGQLPPALAVHWNKGKHNLDPRYDVCTRIHSISALGELTATSFERRRRVALKTLDLLAISPLHHGNVKRQVPCLGSQAEGGRPILACCGGAAHIG